MTDKQYDRKPNGDLAKKPGWFSWRHQTNEAHLLATAGRSRHERRERKRHEAGTEELQPRRCAREHSRPRTASLLMQAGDGMSTPKPSPADQLASLLGGRYERDDRDRDVITVAGST